MTVPSPWQEAGRSPIAAERSRAETDDRFPATAEVLDDRVWGVALILHGDVDRSGEAFAGVARVTGPTPTWSSVAIPNPEARRAATIATPPVARFHPLGFDPGSATPTI